MRKFITIAFILCGYLILPVMAAFAQERVAPINFNPFVNNAAGKKAMPDRKPAAKGTATTPLSLPFFEDFLGYSPLPDSNKWVDFEVYINNTLRASPISRGVATFDALNSIGIPYDSFSNNDYQYADSLTSQTIDLSSDSAGDSVYFSFFYQAAGNGFFPDQQDSLYLFFKNKYGDYELVWSSPGDSIGGDTLRPFQQVMIPVTDSLDFHNAFQFRFVNIAALNWSDAVWNVDYIRLNRNRNIGDTAVNDVGFTTNPSFLLNDYTSMPYRQFMANNVGETSSQYADSLRNNYSITQSVTYEYQGVALNTGTVLRAPSPIPTSVAPYSTVQLPFPAYYSTIPSPGAESTVIFENTYFIQSVSPTDPSGNDTIVKDQVFDNYLAYDDGSAEKSYYLNLFPTLPGKTAVEYHLNVPDTLRGLAIYFGRQVPFASYKYFSIFVYSALQGVNGASADNVLYEQDFFQPEYADSVNHFWYYSFTTPVMLPAGTFYTGTMQPAEGNSDSLYIGLDVNRIGNNHAYFNVVNTWAPSQISGALMIRPLLGQTVDYLAVKDPVLKTKQWKCNTQSCAGASGTGVPWANPGLPTISSTT